MRALHLAAICLLAVPAHATPIINLGSAASFGVLAASTVTNAGLSTITGNAGVSPGTAFPTSVTVTGMTHAGDAVAMQAQTDLTVAYNSAANAACGTNLTGSNLGGLTLTPGSYCFNTSAQLTGTLKLDALGDPNAEFLFQVGSALTTASGSSVTLLDGASGSDVFWQVGSSATLGTYTGFTGSILALASITLDTGTTISDGRALARMGAVTLDTNMISAPVGSVAVPEPASSIGLLAIGLVLLSTIIFWQRSGPGHAAASA